jgi:hypothetical protein
MFSSYAFVNAAMMKEQIAPQAVATSAGTAMPVTV